MNVDMDSIVISIESTTEKASNAIDSLISKLNELQTALSSVGKSSNSFKNIAKNISNTPKTVRTPTSGGGNVNDQLDKLKVNLKDYDVASIFKSESTKGITSEITKYKNELGDVVTVQKKMRDGMDDYYRVTKKTTNESTSGFEKFRSSIAGTIGKLATLGLGAKNLLNHMMELTETSAEYTEAVNLFYTEMGDKAEEAEAWVKKFTDALYLDPSDVMNYMGTFNSLVRGLGVGADNAYKMSKNLTQLAYDLSSYKNISVDSAFDKLQSGIAGQIKGLKQVGVALSQNTLQELANELGIEQRVTTMNEASKAQLRYIQIMRSSTNWQADLGKTMMSTENILRSARTQWTLMTRELGNLAAVIVRAVMPYFIALTQIIKEAARSLANFLGLDINFDEGFKTAGKSAAVSLGGIEDGIGDVGSAAKKAKKDINTMLAPFDDLNVVQTKVESAGSGIGGTSGGIGIGDLPLPEYDALAKLTGEWSDKIEDAKEKLKSLLPILGTIATAIGVMWATNKISTFIGSLGNLASAFGLTKGAAKGLSGVLGGGAGSMALIIAGLVLTIGGLVKEGPKVSKAFHDMITEGKSIKEVSKEFSTLDGIILAFLSQSPIGQIGLGFSALTGIIKGMKEPIVKSTDVIKDMGDRLDETSKKKLTPLVKEFDSLNSTLVGFDLGNKLIDDNDIQTVKDQLSTISSSIIDELDTDKNNRLGDLKTLEKVLGVDKSQELQGKLEKYYGDQKNIITNNENQINSIMETAKNENRALKQEELNEISKLRNEMYGTGVESALEYSDNYYEVMARLKNNTGKLSVEQASEFIKNAKKTKDETIKNAETQYNKILGEAEKLKAAGLINDEEYNDMIIAARKTREDTIKEAETQYDEIYKTTTGKLGDTAKYIDEESGGIKSRWDLLGEDLEGIWDTVWGYLSKQGSKYWQDIKDDFYNRIGKYFDYKYWSNKFKDILRAVETGLEGIKRKLAKFDLKIKTPHFEWVSGGYQTKGAIKTILETLHLPTALPKINIKWYEEGGYPDRASLFWANENGIPEYVGQIGNRTAVANNDQITTSITNALITALSGMNFGGQGTTIVNIGNKKVYEGMGEYIDGENERYGTAYVNI